MVPRDGAARHFERAPHVDAAAIVGGGVVADVAAGDEKVAALVDVDAAAVGRVATGDGAAARAVADGEAGAVLQFDHVAVGGLAGEVAIQGFARQVEGDLLAVHLYAVFAFRVNDVLR